jgi:hypothetical protein
MRRLLIALFAILLASPALAQPATTTAPGTLLTSPLTLQPASRSQAGWTNTGARFANPAITLTDTSTAAGTVANGYTDFFAGDTIATQTNAVTFTNYYGGYRSNPVAGTHVTFTSAWAFGADSLKVNGALSITGAITATGLSSGTQTSCLGLSSGNAFVLSSGACAGSITAGTTPTSGITSGDFLSSTSNLVVDSGVAVPLAPSTYWYPYGAGNANCFNAATCTIPTGQTAAPANTFKGTTLNGLAYLWDNNRWVNSNSIFKMEISTNTLGVTDGNSCIGTFSGSTCTAPTISGKTFSLHFVGISGSPTVSYGPASGSDTSATVATNLCNNVIANATVTNTTTEMVCDANQSGGGFNLQWAINQSITVTSTGTGTITLVNTPNQLDGVFLYHVRAAPSGYSSHAGDLEWCDIYNAYSACSGVRENVAATGLTAEAQFYTAGNQILGISEGVMISCGTPGDGPSYGGLGSLSIGNSGCNGASIYLANSSGTPDARIFENASNALLIRTGSLNELILTENNSTVFADFNQTTANTFTFKTPVAYTNLPSSGGTLYLCLNGSTGAVTAQGGSC